MAIRSFIRIPSPGPTLHPPHQKSAERMLKFPASFPCHDDGPVLQSSSHSSSSSPSTVLFPRRTFLSVGLGLLVGSQFQDAEASVEDDPVGLVNGQLQSCDGGTPCVSTSAFRSPSRFMPPWSYLNSKESAFADLVKTLQRMVSDESSILGSSPDSVLLSSLILILISLSHHGSHQGAKIVETDDDRYVYATLRSSSGENDVDDLEFLFVGNQVCFRSRSRKSIPDPPFCWWPGCINGPRNRQRLEALRDELGWISMETDEEKVWVPLLFH
ncbi:hypothetical protein R1sor_014936 [Riccia sorocarpa]|uniref:Uncharacterized protein n=1 Tax=Riccia sorocarpa TaxID=122646 RepID=A0ABD3HDE9_9MARC